MADPSHRVAQPLQNHVHLISGHRFPIAPSLSIQDAYRYLVDAPQIVKQRAPMSWTYVSAPQDGTMWLEWLSPGRDNRFPSDGYVWCDQEQPYRQELGAYTIEIFVHYVGYRPGMDAMASHARTRYHFIGKAQNANGPPPDPSLWIVHYHQTNPNQALPVNQAPPIAHQQHQILSERKWLESQGRLDKKDFMLHDQEHWPVISVPVAGGHMQRQMQQPGYYGQPQMGGPMGRPNPYQQQPGGYPQQPPQKRQRQSGPVPAPGAADAVQDTTLEDEENTTLGDFFDHLTPRDISMARYMQHHRWMEEVFSSPYASHQIVPADLGLGLMGELRGLTEGILDPPSLDFLSPETAKPHKATESQPFTNLKQDQVEKFNARVEEHLKEGHAEIERMKAEHATKMQEWKKTKALMQAEKRLRYATWEGHEDAVNVFRLEENGQAENGAAKEHVEDVVKEVEGLLGVKIRSHDDAAMVAKGGLEDEPEPPRKLSVQNPQIGLELQQSSTDGTGHLMQQPGQGSMGMSQPAAQTNQQQSSYPPQLAQQSSTTTNDLGGAGANHDTDDMLNLGDDALMEGMDLDMGEPELEFDMSHVDASATPQQTTAQSGASGSTGQNVDNDAAPETANGGSSTEQATSQAQQAAPATSTASGNAGTSTSGADAGQADLAETDDNMFQDNTFDDLTNMNDEGDNDGLIDFDGGMDMGDSAFGDAMHGMDAQGGEPSQAEQQQQQQQQQTRGS